MPELAEVEYTRKRWDVGWGKKIESVSIQSNARIFRDCDTKKLKKGLNGASLIRSESHGKQMIFKVKGRGWLSIHLGMTGDLLVKTAKCRKGKHDHLMLRQKDQTLVLNDPRLFGKVRFDSGADIPEWWKALPPRIDSKEFTLALVRNFLKRRKGSCLKAILLMQEAFPGIGNWMADEILWRCRFHPARLGGSLSEVEICLFYREIRRVCELALKHIDRPGDRWGDPPASWLFGRRWADGGICPKSKVPLVREVIGGRMTCWSPGRQPLP